MIEIVVEPPEVAEPAIEDVPLVETEPIPAALDEADCDTPVEGEEVAETIEIPPKTGPEEDDTATEGTREVAEEGTTEEIIGAEALDTALGVFVEALKDEPRLAEDNMEATDDEAPATDDDPALRAEDTDWMAEEAGWLTEEPMDTPEEID